MPAALAHSAAQLPLFPEAPPEPEVSSPEPSPPPLEPSPPRPEPSPSRPEPSPPPGRSDAITADFAGAACPVGSRVRFPWRGQAIDGTVAALQRARAVVAAGDDALWKVPYRLLTVLERAPERECTLADVEGLAHRLLARHKAGSGLDAAWGFGFDLSTARAGVCRYDDRRIDLSVSYCLRATRAEIEDTLLHEIAHAIAGHRHHHDAVWKAVARAIGCTAERCHDVDHTPARWLGECGCGKQWRRQRLSRRLRRGARCRKCGGEIAWRLNTGAGASPSVFPGSTPARGS